MGIRRQGRAKNDGLFVWRTPCAALSLLGFLFSVSDFAAANEAATRISGALLEVDSVTPSRELLAATVRRRAATTGVAPIPQAHVGQTERAAAAAVRNRGVLLVRACVASDWIDKALYCPHEVSPRSVGIISVSITDESPDLEPPAAMQAVLQLNGAWTGADYRLQIDGERAQANTYAGLPFRWERFLVRAVPEDNRVKFAIGADLYEATVNGDSIALKSTAFRGERLLSRSSAR
jgi:hypothetical protein